MTNCDTCKFNLICFEMELEELRNECPCGECIVKNVCTEICDKFNTHYFKHKLDDIDDDNFHIKFLIKNSLSRHRLLRECIFSNHV